MAGQTRRRVLGLGAAALSVAPLTGCLGGPLSDLPNGQPAEAGETTAQASFFVLGDFAAHVAGTAATAETVVPVGQHGHGWEPGPRVREAVHEADLFIYGTPGFQPWADDVARDLQVGGQDVHLVAIADGIDLLESEADDHDGDAHAGAPSDGIETDPHFWLDPLRANQAVDSVHRGFVTVDPDNANAYDSNATMYRDRIDELHETFETRLATRSRDRILVAGHDAFGYLQDRYGFAVAALTGIAPDDRPSPRDIARAQQVIGEHDLEYICADPLESQRAAEQLVAETAAREVLPLTAMPGRLQAWVDEGWGYVDIMERVNLPTLARALEAT